MLNMKWLAVKYFDDNYLFSQSRQERETQNSVLIDESKLIETIVIKTFDTENEANDYCRNINLTNEIIKKL